MAVSTIDPAGLNIGQIGGRRNLIINGAMQVWQRGTSFTPSSVIFGADRFAAYKSGASAGDYARSTDVPSGQGFTYSGYFNGADIRQSIELPAAGQRGVFVDGSNWTLSFWVKAGASGTSTVNLGWANGVTASSVTYWGSNQSYSYSASWEKKTITFTVGGSITGSHAAVLVYISSVPGLYITGVQLEASPSGEPTPFEHRSYGEELNSCKRFYQKFGNLGGYDVVAFAGIAPYTTQVQAATPLSPEMRVTPSLSLANIAAADTVNPQVAVTSAAVSSGTHNNKIAWVAYYTSGSLTAFRPYYLRVDGTSTGYIAFDAEL